MLLKDLTNTPNSSFPFSGSIVLKLPFAIFFVPSASKAKGSDNFLLSKNPIATAVNIASISTSVKVIEKITFNESRL